MKTGKKRLFNKLISLVLCFSMVMFSAVPVAAKGLSPVQVDGDKVRVADVYTQGKTTTGSSITGSGIKASLSAAAVIVDVFQGEGTRPNPYIISDEADLRNMATKINAGSQEYDKKFFEIKKDSHISLTDEWIPIGTKENPFTGYFNGNSEVVENVKITSPSAVKYQGFFGYNKGTISDLIVTGTIKTDADYVGGIAGYSEGEILNCTFGLNGDSYVKGNNYVGGVAGYSSFVQKGLQASPNIINSSGHVEGNENIGGIYGCISGNENEISYAELTNTGSVSGSVNTGGIIGFSTGSAIFSNSVKLINKGDIAAEKSDAGGIFGALSDDEFVNILELHHGAEALNAGSISTGGSRVGGIAGALGYLVFDTNSKAVNTGKIEGVQSDVGGIAGYLSLGLSAYGGAEVTNRGNVETGENNAGGIVGCSRGGLNFGTDSKICNEGNVTVLKSNAGGLIGSTSGSIFMGSSSNAINEGAITALKSNAGGLIGFSEGSDTQFREAEVINKGNIKTEGNNGGGIIGSALSATFSTNSKITNEGKVWSVSDAGGIIGSLAGKLSTEDDAQITNKGRIEAEGSNSGGIIGSAENSTFDTNSRVTNEGTVVAKLDNAGGIAGSAKKITVRGSAEAVNTGPVKAENNNAGGLVGLCSGDIDAYAGFVTNNAGIKASALNAGGIAGRIEVPNGLSFTISKAAVMGGYVSAVGNAGGIAGYVSGKLNIKDSYNKAVISAENSSYGAIIASAADGADVYVSDSFSYINNGGTMMEIPLTKISGVSVQNSYYLVGDTYHTEGDIAARKIDEFRYGRIAYTIDTDAKGNRKSLWGQKLGTDETPTHFDGNKENSMHPVVYKNELHKNEELQNVKVDFDIKVGSSYKVYGNFVYMNKGSEVKLNVSGLDNQQVLLFSPSGFVTFIKGEYKLTGDKRDTMLTYSTGFQVPADTSWYNNDDTTFELNTEAELLGLAELVTGDGMDFKDKKIILAQDISMSASIWNPIGTKEVPFRGSFESKEKPSEDTAAYAVINNFNNTVGNSNFGVFGYVEDAVIKNLAVSGYAIATATEGQNIAGIAADSKNSRFVNCVNNVALTGTAIVGGITSVAKESTYEGCINLAPIYSSGTGGNAAGVAGISYKSNFESCKNRGYVQSAGNAGGIVSRVSGESSLRDCVNECTIEGSMYIGGIVGNVFGTKEEKIKLIRCSNSEKGAVKGTGTYVGGVAGIAGSFATLKYCYNSGLVDSQADNAAGVAGTLFSGAIVEGCYNSEKGTVKNKGEYTAGVFGRVGMNTKLGEIYNAGTVIGDGDYTAGVFAYGSEGMYDNVRMCYNTGDVEGNGLYVAGICADLRGEKKYSSDMTSHLYQCYNLGTVTGTGNNTKAAGITGTNYVNGVGSVCSYVVDCYNLGKVVSVNPDNVGAISALNWSGNENSYYCTGSVQLPDVTEPVDHNNAILLDKYDFESGKAAYLLDEGGTINRKKIWGQGNGHPVPAVQQNSSIYKVTIVTSGPSEGFEGEGNDVNKINCKGFEASKDSFVEVYSPIEKEISILFNEKAGYLLNTVSALAADKKIEVDVNDDAKTIKLYLTEDSDIKIDVNFIKSPAVLMPYYTFIYNANGGQWQEGITEVSMQVKGGTRAKKPELPVNNSLPNVKQKLTGWYTEKECTTPYDFTGAVIWDMTLYAGWETVQQHDVIFDANGGNFKDTGEITVKVDDGERVEKPILDPIRKDYNFRGWYTDESCLHLYDFDSTVTAGFKLYAGWAENGKCVVVFDGNGGKVKNGDKFVEAVSVTVKKSEKITSLTAERADEGTSTFTFKGWYDKDGHEWDFYDFVEESMTLTAKWDENFFQVPGEYEIGNLEALETFRDEVNEKNTYENSVFRLTADIKLPSDWVSIGYSNKPSSINWDKGFRGTFDGGGHTITIDNDQTMPVFGVLGYKGVIKDINIEGNHVYNMFVPLVKSSHGEVNNVEVSGEFYRCVSGVVLEAYTGLIKNCRIKSGSVIEGDGAVGGILSLSRSGGIDGNCVEIDGCVVEPGVRITASDGDDIVQALGGIVAYGMGLVENCVNGGDLTAEYTTTGSIVGGIAGTVNSVGQSSIVRCVNTGDIITPGGTAGGIAGTISQFKREVGINYCYSTGNISSAGHVDYLGGIGGDVSGIANSYWYGEFLDVPEGTEAMGAITGYNGSGLSVENCYYGVKASGSYESKETISDKSDGKGSTKLTAEKFEIGRVAYLIDGGNEEHENNWTQDFTKRYPVLGNPSIYMITIDSSGPGYVEINGLKDIAFWGNGQTVSIESFPDKSTETEEYKLDKILVSDSKGKQIDCGDKELEFNMPKGNVTISAEFIAVKKPVIPPEEPGKPEDPIGPDKPKPDESHEKDDNDNSSEDKDIKEVKDGGTIDGNGIGDGTGEGLGDGTGTGTDIGTDGNQGGNLNTGVGTPVSDSDNNKNDKVPVVAKLSEQPESREEIVAKVNPTEKSEKQQSPPAPEEKKEPDEPDEPEKPEEESSTVFKTLQDNIREKPVVVVVVVLVILLINGVIAFIRFKKLKK